MGDYQIVVPPGAVSKPLNFKIRRPPPGNKGETHSLVEFLPHGAEFDVPVTVRLPYASRTRPQVVRWTGGEWEGIATELTPDGRAEAQTAHFSTYGEGLCVLIEDPELDPEACRPVADDLCPSCSGLYVNGWTESVCTETTALWFVDDDYDSMDDWCEFDLTKAFAPELIVRTDCNWDSSLNRLGGEYFWGATLFVARQKLQSIYLPAYYWDCGAGAGLFEPGPHTGDNEFIVIQYDFNTGTNHFTTNSVFLSAHCGTANGGDCRWWNPPDFQYWGEGVSQGRPTVWSSGQ